MRWPPSRCSSSSPGYDGGGAIGVWLLLAAWRGWLPRGAGAARARPRRPRCGDPARALGRARRGDRARSLLVRRRRLPALGRERRDGIVRRSHAPALVGVRQLVAVHRPPDRCSRPLGVAPALRTRRGALLVIWGAFSLTGFAIGGLFHPHYFVGLIAPFSALAAVGAQRLADGYGTRIATVACAVLLAVPAIAAWPVVSASSPSQVSWRTSHDGRILSDRTVGAWLRARTRPGDTVYAMYAEASLYFAADRPPAFKYLWFLGEQRIPHALTDLRDVLAGPDAPRYIVVYQAPRGDARRRRRGHSRSAARALRAGDAGRRATTCSSCTAEARRAGRHASRYAASVKQRTLGSSGIAVSAIGLGCMGMSWAYGDGDDAESVAVIDRALELGITFLDTSDVYGPFTNEELVGRALAGRRDEVVLATKGGLVVEDRANYVLGTRRPARAHPRGLRGSLRRLGVDVIDLYYLHRVDPDVPVEESYGVMAELVAEGKVRALGLSEVDVPDARARRRDPSGHRAAVRALALDARRARRRAALVHRARRRVRAVRAARPRLPDGQARRSTRPSARATSAAGTRASSPTRSRRTRRSSSGSAAVAERTSAPRRRRSRSPGCWPRARTSSRSPARSACATSRRTSARPRSSSAPTRSPRLDARPRARGNALLTVRPSPLRSELEAAGAVFAERSGDEVAVDVRRPAAEYAATHDGLAVSDRSARAFVGRPRPRRRASCCSRSSRTTSRRCASEDRASPSC